MYIIGNIILENVYYFFKKNLYNTDAQKKSEKENYKMKHEKKRRMKYETDINNI